MKDKEWLEEDNIHNIGGRDTDISQIAYSLRYKVTDIFDIIPRPIIEKLEQLTSICENCEKIIQETIELISIYEMRKKENNKRIFSEIKRRLNEY